MNANPVLSVVVITYNEERAIERCLGSIRGAGEIIVVDSFSSDATIERARKFAPVIIQHEYDGDIRQRMRGFERAGGEWLLYIDADEELSPALREEILRTIASPQARDGYLLTREVRAFGKWIRHGGWYPDRTLRLFRRGRFAPEYAEVHGGFTVQGEPGLLEAPLYHYTYDSIEEYLSKMNDYTSLQVADRLKAQPSTRAVLGKILFSPASHFFRKYFVNRGYRDGFAGFLLAVLGGLYTLALYAKVWEYRLREREGKGLLPPITNLELYRLKR